MTYSATAFRLLLSAPSDVLECDLAAARASINRWNVIYGSQSGAVVVPMSWTHHSVASYGERPQDALNEQLVDKADIVIALFWYRFGSPTGEAESGTVEEIERAHDNGAYVGILRCGRPFPTDIDTGQLQKLREFYDSVQSHSLLVDYADEGDLQAHVDAVLTAATTAARTRTAVEIATSVTTTRSGAELWPRIETSHVTESDVRGRLRTGSRHELVIANRGSEAARNVRWKLETEDDSSVGALPMVVGQVRPIEALAPEGEAKYSLLATAGTTQQCRAIVAWEDSDGAHENMATLRLY